MYRTLKTVSLTEISINFSKNESSYPNKNTILGTLTNMEKNRAMPRIILSRTLNHLHFGFPPEFALVF